MSWPADGKPRYVVASDPPHGDLGVAPNVAGFRLRVPAVAYVYDRAYCHRIVARFSAGIELFARRQAKAHAERMNAA